MGWTNRGSEAPVPRQDQAPRRFYEEKVAANPACAAWDEPGYIDPEAAHADLPIGTRYWQGFAKRSTPREERAMSPEWITRVTRVAGRLTPPGNEESDPLREHLVRSKETERLSDRPASFLPG